MGILPDLSRYDRIDAGIYLIFRERLEVRMSSKRKKMELLLTYGLRDAKEFESAVRIFSSQDITAIHEYCLSQLASGNNLIVIAVPMQYERNLPNFFVGDEQALCSLFVWLSTSDNDRYNEVWCCPQGRKNMNLFGRILLKTDDITKPAIVEMVYAKSARAIDRFGGTDDFVSGVYDYFDRYITVNAIVRGQFDENYLLANMSKGLNYLFEEKQDSIQKFARDLHAIGIADVCLEYVLRDNYIAVIDFDTSNDEKVIREIR